MSEARLVIALACPATLGFILDTRKRVDKRLACIIELSNQVKAPLIGHIAKKDDGGRTPRSCRPSFAKLIVMAYSEGTRRDRATTSLKTSLHESATELSGADNVMFDPASPTIDAFEHAKATGSDAPVPDHDVPEMLLRLIDFELGSSENGPRAVTRAKCLYVTK